MSATGGNKRLRRVTKSKTCKQVVSVLERTAPGQIELAAGHADVCRCPVIEQNIGHQYGADQRHGPQQARTVDIPVDGVQAGGGVADAVEPRDNSVTAECQAAQRWELVL